MGHRSISYLVSNTGTRLLRSLDVRRSSWQQFVLNIHVRISTPLPIKLNSCMMSLSEAWYGLKARQGILGTKPLGMCVLVSNKFALKQLKLRTLPAKIGLTQRAQLQLQPQNRGEHPKNRLRHAARHKWIFEYLTAWHSMNKQHSIAVSMIHSRGDLEVEKPILAIRNTRQLCSNKSNTVVN